MGGPHPLWPAFLSLLSLPWAWFFLNRIISPLKVVRLRRLPQVDPGPGPLFTGRLTIGAYNLHHGFGVQPCAWRRPQRFSRRELDNRLNSLAALLKEANLDLVVLNEVDFASFRTYHQNQAAYLAANAGFPFWVEQTNVDAALFFWRHRYGNALLSRYPLNNPRLVRLPGHRFGESVCWGKKNGLICDVQPSRDNLLRIMAIHLDHRLETTRIKSVRVIERLRRTSPVPLILAGDFNSSPAHYPSATLDPSGQTALSWLLAQGGYQTRPQTSELPSPQELTFSTLNPTQVIDWILVPGDWHILSHRVVDAGLSDHRLVLMEVDMKAGEKM